MDHTVSRRHALLASVAVATAVTTLPAQALAQDATPAESHGDLPDPLVASRPTEAITWTVTDDSLSVPEAVVAGLNHLTIQNESSFNFHIITFSVPDDADDDELMAFLADETAPFPEWFADQWFPGNPDHAAAGAAISGHTFYYPGRYVAYNLITQAHAQFHATGNPWGVPEPRVDREIGMVEMSFIGLEGTIPAGPETWRVVNNGATWHEIAVLASPGATTPDEVMALLMAGDGPDGMPEGYEFVGGVGIMSPGAAVLVEMDLAPGDYTALCFAPDGFVGPPHIVQGMMTVFHVE